MAKQVLQSPFSIMAPFARRLLHTAVELSQAAKYRGVVTSPSQSLAALFGSAPLLSSRRAESQASKKQARNSGVAWGGVWEGLSVSPLCTIHHQVYMWRWCSPRLSHLLFSAAGDNLSLPTGGARSLHQSTCSCCPMDPWTQRHQAASHREVALLLLLQLYQQADHRRHHCIDIFLEQIDTKHHFRHNHRYQIINILKHKYQNTTFWEISAEKHVSI